MKTVEYPIDHYEVTEATDEFRIIDGLIYWEDNNHFGAIYLTQEMYDKYDLKRCPCCETLEEAYDDMADELRESPEFIYVISIDHCAGVTPLGVEQSSADRLGDKWVNYVDNSSYETPHGDCYDEDFIAWWCEFPVELLNEPDENVRIGGWSDG